MRTNDERLTIQVQVSVNAELVLKLPDGTTRPPTNDELKSLRLHSESEMYERRVRLFRSLGADPHDEDDALSALRSFIEHVTHYDFDPEPETVEHLRLLLWPKTNKDATPEESS